MIVCRYDYYSSGGVCLDSGVPSYSARQTGVGQLCMRAISLIRAPNFVYNQQHLSAAATRVSDAVLLRTGRSGDASRSQTECHDRRPGPTSHELTRSVPCRSGIKQICKTDPQSPPVSKVAPTQGPLGWAIGPINQSSTLPLLQTTQRQRPIAEPHSVPSEIRLACVDN